MSRLRAENRARQRERILAAAFDLFAEQAFADVTVTEVAAAAEVSRATVFNHFRSKQGLIDAITEKVLLYYREMLDAALANEESPTPALLRAMPSPRSPVGKAMYYGPVVEKFLEVHR